jgi:hypothetical protein
MIMAAKLTRLTHKIAIKMHLVAELYHLQFSLLTASPETSEYILVVLRLRMRGAIIPLPIRLYGAVLS